MCLQRPQADDKRGQKKALGFLRLRCMQWLTAGKLEVSRSLYFYDDKLITSEIDRPYDLASGVVYFPATSAEP